MAKERTLTFDEFAKVFAKAMTMVMRKNPTMILIADELTAVAAVCGHLLFDEEEGEENGENTERRD